MCTCQNAGICIHNRFVVHRGRLIPIFLWEGFQWLDTRKETKLAIFFKLILLWKHEGYSRNVVMGTTFNIYVFIGLIHLYSFKIRLLLFWCLVYHVLVVLNFQPLGTSNIPWREQVAFRWDDGCFPPRQHVYNRCI
jgi:hypothetical protein